MSTAIESPKTEAYAELVNKLANQPHRPKLSEHLDALADAGVEYAEFLEAVSARRREIRESAITLLAECDRMEVDELDVLVRESNAAVNALNNLERRHREELEAATNHLRDAMNADGELRHKLAARREKARKRLIATADPGLQSQIDRLQVEIGYIKQATGRAVGLDPASQATAKDARERIAPLQAQIAELEQRKLDPAAVAV